MKTLVIALLMITSTIQATMLQAYLYQEATMVTEGDYKGMLDTRVVDSRLSLDSFKYLPAIHGAVYKYGQETEPMLGYGLSKWCDTERVDLSLSVTRWTDKTIRVSVIAVFDIIK